ncbi:MAG: protein phosphatase CheZ [Nitrospirae bacterium]|nr:protein phosphatase CheZ [Nitrospirota bacterium]
MQAQKENGNIKQLVSFTVGEDKFAIEISDIHEINRFEHINRIPDMPPHFLGVIDLRGAVIPVVNLADKLGIQNQDISKDTRIIIVGFNGDKIGILVDGVSEVIRTSIESLEKPPSVFRSLNSEYICGIIRNNKQLIIVLDLPRLFKESFSIFSEQPQFSPEEINRPHQDNIVHEVQNNDVQNNDVINKIVEVTKAMAEGDFHQELNENLYGQIGELAKYINSTIKKLQAVEPNIASVSDKIPEASLQLSEISKFTEQATHTVMGQVEQVLDSQDSILNHIEGLEKGGDVKKAAGEIKQIVMDNKEAMMDIITGLSFQDLTGQKIKVIVGLIEEVEKRILQLIVAFGLKSKDNVEENIQQIEFKDNTTLKQDDVESILKEFGFV